MKKIVLSALISFSFFAARSQWVDQYVPFGPHGVASYFFDLQAVDANVVWGSIWRNVPSPGTPYTTNYARTIDGGNNWTVDSIKIVASTFAISNIWPIDGNTCYLCMYNSATTGSRGGIYKTTNGGTAWAQVG